MYEQRDAWAELNARIDLLSALARREIERMADEALVAIGFGREYVNRRRGQLRRHANKRTA